MPGWGPVEEILLNLGLDYKVVFLGTEAAMRIKSRLQAGVPTLFYLWSPHSLNAQFSLSRIQLPPYSTRARFEEGRSDFPTDVLEKLAAKNLAEISPNVASLFAQITMETATQERLLFAIDAGRQTVMEAVCGWLTVEENTGVWRRWLNDHTDQPPVVRPSEAEPPVDRPLCSESEIILDREAMRRDYLSALRESIINASAHCRSCMVAIATSVLGERFSAEGLHFVFDELVPCPPALASRIATEASILSAAQASELGNAIRSQEPFGLSITVPANPETNSTVAALVQDLFLPTDEALHGQLVLRGVDSNHSMFACSRITHFDTWAISSSAERSSWERCEADVWIDSLSGEAQSAAATNGSSVISVAVHRRLGSVCGLVLHAPTMPSVSAGTLAFPKAISADAVACWLARLFGPQSSIPVGIAPSAMELPVGLGSVHLLTDIVLVRGRSLTVKGGDNTIIVGSHQVRIEPDAVLTLEAVTVADSIMSTAIAVEAGTVMLHNSTVCNCSAYMNALNADGLLESRGGAISVSAGGRLELDSVELHGNSASEGEAQSAGGAIYCTGGSAIVVVQSKLYGNVAHRAGLASRDLHGVASGGAIFLKESSLAVTDSELFRNVARDGGFFSMGGAVYGRDGSSLSVRGSKLQENLVENGGLLFSAEDKEDAGCYGGAIWVEYECSVDVIECELCGNTVRAGVQWTNAGAIGLYDGCSLLIAKSKVLRNAAHGGGDGISGGAFVVYGGDRPSIAFMNASELSDNRATGTDGALSSEGGAVDVLQAQLTVVDCKLHRNVASGGARALGGALTLDAGSAVLVQRSDLSGNMAAVGVQSTYGGGIYADVQNTGELQIESTKLYQNCANGSAALAAGGGLYLASGSATVIDSDLTANMVLGQTALGGAMCLGSSSGTIRTIRTRFLRNRVHSVGADGEALGGGIFNRGAVMRLVDSHLLENVASIASPAERASAGGVYNAVGARAFLDGCLLRSNDAGGIGLLQATSYSYDDDKRAAYEASKAAHIFTSGRMELIGTTLVGESSFARIGYAAQRWIVVGEGQCTSTRATSALGPILLRPIRRLDFGSWRA